MLGRDQEVSAMTIEVRHEGGDRFAITMGRHRVVVDQPGSGDEGPTPTELFVASLASCAAFYAGRFLARHGVATDGLGVSCSYAMAEDRPARVGAIDLRLLLPAGFPPALEDRVRAVVERCTVRNSIASPPDVSLELSSVDDPVPV
jgi:putative redox protein